MTKKNWKILTTVPVRCMQETHMVISCYWFHCIQCWVNVNELKNNECIVVEVSLVYGSFLSLAATFQSTGYIFFLARLNFGNTNILSKLQRTERYMNRITPIAIS